MQSRNQNTDTLSDQSYTECLQAACSLGFAWYEAIQNKELEDDADDHTHPTLPWQPKVVDISGRQWLHNLLSDKYRCFNNLRMTPETFYKLHDILTSKHGLISRGSVDSIGALGLFLWACGTNQSMRQIEERSRKSLRTCSDFFNRVLKSVVSFSNYAMRPIDNPYGELPNQLVEYSPFFDDCIGAVDNTHINVVVDDHVRDDHLNRYNNTTQNVLCICDFNMRFIYIAAGTEGSAHDMRVMKRAMEDPHFPHPPFGKYYLGDSGFTLAPTMMVPYPLKRSRLKDFDGKPPTDAFEVFNRSHSSIRNIIERTFGAAKQKWKKLNSIPHYSGIKQSEIIIALCALHNFVHELEGANTIKDIQPVDLGPLAKVVAAAKPPPNEVESLRDWILLGLFLIGKH